MVVPVKGTPLSKSRMAPGLDADQRYRLMTGFALDTVSALLAARRVERVIAVTDAASGVAEELRGAGAEIVADPGTGLNAAIAAGIAAARAGAEPGAQRARASQPEPPVAALLGDLPRLTAADVDAALEQAEQHPLALVADADGSGSTLITARTGNLLVPRYGEGSAARHAAAGHSLLDIPVGSGLRADVDTEADLAAAVARGVGPHTRAALGI